jgi:virginiamycin B lyase
MTVTGAITRQFLWTRPGLLSRAPSGNLSFATNDSIWQRSPSGDIRHLAALPPGGQSGLSSPSDLTISPDGSVWFLQTEADRLGRIGPDGTITFVPLTQAGDGFIRPSSLTAGPDGSIWVSAALARRLARVDGRTLTVTQFQVSTGGGTVDAQSVAADAAGGVWFERSTGSAMDTRPPEPALGRMDRTGKITYHPLPGAGPRWPGSLTAGPDGTIWFLDGPAKTVGRMAPDGTVTEFPFADPEVSGPTTGHLAAGPSALWFSQPQTNSLGLLTCQ